MIKKNRKRNKGVYFTVDSIIAASIIFFSLLLITAAYKEEHRENPTYQKASDLVKVFSSTKVSELNNSYVMQLISNGTISRANNTIFEQLGEFWISDEQDLAQEFLGNIVDGLVSEQFGMSVHMDGQEIFIQDKPVGEVLISSRKMMTGLEKDKPTEGYTARVLLGSVQHKRVNSYAYFGGYVGDGVITHTLQLPSSYDNIIDAYMEFAISSDFTLHINGLGAGNYSNKQANEMKADTYNISSAYFSHFKPGLNEIKITFLNQSRFIGGGFFRVNTNSTTGFLPYQYNETTHLVTKKEHLVGVDGVINVYSSFYVPGDLQSIRVFLNATTNYPLFMSFGNTTIFESNETEVINITLTDAQLLSTFNGNYGDLSGKTIPLRMGHYSSEKLGDFSRFSDAFVATDVSTSMDITDVEDAVGQSRLSVAKTVEKTFVDFVFNKSLENRLGLVSYHSSVEPGQSQDLTNNNVTLKNKIDGYDTKSSNTCFSCAIKFAQDRLIAQGNTSHKWAIILMTDGTADKCDAIPQSQCTPAAAKNESILYACNAYNNWNISIYAIGFGVGADNVTLKNISQDCSDGQYFYSKNKSGLQNAFEAIAEEILSLSFTYQKTVAQGVSSSLSEDSFIELTYTPDVPPVVFGKIPITFEGPSFKNNISYGLLNVTPSLEIIEALATSYSGDKWTKNATLDGTKFFDLKVYNASYVELGDPFLVNIPVALIHAGINNVTLQTASGPSSPGFGGSEDDRLIYTALVQNSMSYTAVSSKAQGCHWFITFADGSNTTLKVPSSYNGNATCDFSTGSYDSDDAINKAGYLLLSDLDFDQDGRLDVNVNEQSLAIEATIIDQVPSLWGPAIAEVRVWQ